MGARGNCARSTSHHSASPASTSRPQQSGHAMAGSIMARGRRCQCAEGRRGNDRRASGGAASRGRVVPAPRGAPERLASGPPVRRRNEDRVAEAASRRKCGEEAPKLARREVADGYGAGASSGPADMRAMRQPRPSRRVASRGRKRCQSPGDLPRAPTIHDGAEERRPGRQEAGKGRGDEVQVRLAVQGTEVAVCAVESGDVRQAGRLSRPQARRAR